MEFKTNKKYYPYGINENGVIKNLLTGKIMKTRISTHGYVRTSLYKNGIKFAPSVHRMLAEIHIPNPHNKVTVNHIDGNKLNNTLNNLEWATVRENTIHAYENDLSTSNVRVIVKDLETNEEKEYRSLQYFSKIIGVHLKGLISYIKFSYLYPFNNRYVIKVVDENRLLNSENGGGRKRVYVYDIVEDKQYNFSSIGSCSYMLGLRSVTKISKKGGESIGFIINYREPPKPKDSYFLTKEQMAKNREKYRSKSYVQKLYKVAAIDLLSEDKKVIHFETKREYVDYINNKHNINDSVNRFCNFKKIPNKKLLLYRGYLIQEYNDVSELKPWRCDYTLEDVYNSRLGRSISYRVYKDNYGNLFLSAYFVLKKYEDKFKDKSILYSSLTNMTTDDINKAIDPSYNIIITRLNSVTIKI